MAQSFWVFRDGGMGCSTRAAPQWLASSPQHSPHFFFGFASSFRFRPSLTSLLSFAIAEMHAHGVAHGCGRPEGGFAISDVFLGGPIFDADLPFHTTFPTCCDLVIGYFPVAQQTLSVAPCRGSRGFDAALSACLANCAQLLPRTWHI